MSIKRSVVIWGVLASAIAIPLAFAATSPLLQWREPVYIAAGFAGVIAMIFLLLQPLLATAVLPGLSSIRARRIHRLIGVTLVIAIMVHVAGLWFTSPPDVIDALLFRSATTFSIWGVVAMWALLATAAVAVLRHKFRISPRVWRTVHKTLAVVIVTGSVVHAMLIDGTMESISKFVLCLFVLIITFIVISGKGLEKIKALTKPDSP